MTKNRKWHKIIEHEVCVQVSENFSCTVFVKAPDNMSLWKLTRLAAQKLELMNKTPNKRKQRH